MTGKTFAPADLPCPECGARMQLRSTPRFTYRDGLPRQFYGCSRWPACPGSHGAHPDGSPVGVPANRETKAARMRAHAAFDALWKGGELSRADAYRWMRKALQLDAAEAHIGRFDIDLCERLVAAVAAREGAIEGI